MIFSMTAFGRSDQDTGWGSLVWELRSVNHRYLELSLKLPEEFRALEPQVRQALGARLGRGKVDVCLRFKSHETLAELKLDEQRVSQLAEFAAQIVARTQTAAPLRTVDYLRWPGVLVAPEMDTEALTKAALLGLDQALGALVEMRAGEGARMRALIEQRLDNMEQILAGLKPVLPEIVQQYRERLRTRLAEVAQELDAARLEQEMVMFAQRMDVEEELDRLDAHLQEVRRILKQGGAIGRRLDFLMQEFNREANTLGSKAADLRQTNAAVELKVLIEQMREQVQNIE